MKPKMMGSTTAADIMTSPVLTVMTSDALETVARLFTQKAIGAAAVISESGKPVGVITKTDLVRYGTDVWGKQRLPFITEGDTAERWMTPAVLSVAPSATACAMAQRMVRYHMHHMFVKGPGPDEVVGIVSSLDLLRAYIADCGDEVPGDIL